MLRHNLKGAFEMECVLHVNDQGQVELKTRQNRC